MKKPRRNASAEWRAALLRRCGPGVLAGITFGQWVRLLRGSDLSMDASCFPRAVAITLQSLKNAVWARVELRKYGDLLDSVTLQPPIFILGHWRNGTTHLHQIMAQDKRFAFPNSYQVSFPQNFLSTEAWEAPMAALFLPPRRPMDGMEWTLASPQEDEFALCASTWKSPCMGWVFPRQRERFAKYLTFRDVPPAEIGEWRDAFERFLRKLQLRNDRPIILKSPPHTARVSLLLEMFPAAKFIHIHRNPVAVFQSCRKAFDIILDWHRLQRRDANDLDEWIIRQYREMYDAFFEARPLIPAGQFCEVAFEELEEDPIGQVKKIYETLGLPSFETFEPALREYMNSLAGYKKNAHPDLSPQWKARLKSSWQRCFEEWGY
jgi:hypothetical protein